MSIEQLEQNLEVNFKNGVPQEFETLFHLFTQTEVKALIKSGAKKSELENASDQLADYQDKLISVSAKLTATSMEDILFKIALWRRYAAQIDPFDSTMTGDEKLAYSIFRDMALMCHRDDVFTERDTQYLLSC